MTINLIIQDESDVPYDLSSYLIDFGRIRSGETKKVKVILKNVGFTTQEVTLQAIPHPTSQVGLPENTYEAASLSLSESGTYYEILNVGTIGPNTETDIWIQWQMPPQAIPGAARFALQANGKVIWT